jgi:hypothetical protein
MVSYYQDLIKSHRHNNGFTRYGFNIPGYYKSIHTVNVSLDMITVSLDIVHFIRRLIMGYLDMANVSLCMLNVIPHMIKGSIGILNG